MAEQEQQPDDRPRPQFGELAPPGWVWHPPADADRLDTSRRVDEGTDTDAPPDRLPGSHTTGSQDGDPHRGVGAPTPDGYFSRNARPGQPPSTWNLTLTIVLGVLGFFGMTYSIATLQAIPASMQLLHTTNGLGEYIPAPIVGTLVTVGSIVMAVIWAVSAGIAAWLLAKRRLAFWVPLVAGIVAMVALLIFAGAVLATDPVLLSFYSGVPPSTPSPTSTPLQTP